MQRRSLLSASFMSTILYLGSTSANAEACDYTDVATPWTYIDNQAYCTDLQNSFNAPVRMITVAWLDSLNRPANQKMQITLYNCIFDGRKILFDAIRQANDSSRNYTTQVNYNTCSDGSSLRMDYTPLPSSIGSCQAKVTSTYQTLAASFNPPVSPDQQRKFVEQNTTAFCAAFENAVEQAISDFLNNKN